MGVHWVIGICRSMKKGRSTCFQQVHSCTLLFIHSLSVPVKCHALCKAGQDRGVLNGPDWVSNSQSEPWPCPPGFNLCRASSEGGGALCPTTQISVRDAWVVAKAKPELLPGGWRSFIVPRGDDTSLDNKLLWSHKPYLPTPHAPTLSEPDKTENRIRACGGEDKT